jgi:mannose-6-phosphate isomerase-like protein (cupin superfamily)
MMPRRHAHLMFIIAAVVAGHGWFAADAQGQSHAVASNSNDSARVILQRYADAWRGRQELEFDGPLVIAFAVRGPQGGDFNLTLGQEPGAVVAVGLPAGYDIAFELDIEFLRRLDRGEMNALTAMGQARSTDPIPLSPKPGPDFLKRPDAALLFRRVSFHFWNRQWPEIVPFGEAAAREVHGANAAVLAYDQDFRSAWYQLKPGMHINADPKDQTNTFPQLVIVIRGPIRARLDGNDCTLSQGQAIYIPAGMRHEFWAEPGQDGELVWTAFGKGA